MPILAKTLNKMYLLSFIGFLAFFTEPKEVLPTCHVRGEDSTAISIRYIFLCTFYFQKNNL